MVLPIRIELILEYYEYPVLAIITKEAWRKAAVSIRKPRLPGSLGLANQDSHPTA